MPRPEGLVRLLAGQLAAANDKPAQLDRRAGNATEHLFGNFPDFERYPPV
jgi:hypothetical protein